MQLQYWCASDLATTPHGMSIWEEKEKKHSGFVFLLELIFRGVYVGGGKNENGIWESWDSITEYPHLHKVFVWTFIILVVAIIFQIFFFLLTLLIVLTSCMPLK